MSIAQREHDTHLQWFQADEEILAGLRPGARFDARASFQVFGERQFGASFAAVACCCELPAESAPRWEAALELRKQVQTEVVKFPLEQLAIAFADGDANSETFLLELTA
jgi:hypothetical protein